MSSKKYCPHADLSVHELDVVRDERDGRRCGCVAQAPLERVPEGEVVSLLGLAHHGEQIEVAPVAGVGVVDPVAAGVAAEQNEQPLRHRPAEEGDEGGELLSLRVGQVVE
jgi:hypothetical protein